MYCYKLVISSVLNGYFNPILQDLSTKMCRPACTDLNLLTTNVPHHIETSRLICRTNQLTGFYMMGNIGR